MSASVPPRTTAEARPEPRRSVMVCGLIGMATMAAVDEIVFHQILGWHHFYDRSTPAVGLMSDGLLHSGELVALVAGFFLYADLRRRRALAPRFGWGGLLLGLGAFQLFDGIVDHKLLRLHQIRYGVDVTPYDVVWNAAGLFMLLVGLAVVVHATRHHQAASAS